MAKQTILYPPYGEQTLTTNKDSDNIKSKSTFNYPEGTQNHAFHFNQEGDGTRTQTQGKSAENGALYTTTGTTNDQGANQVQHFNNDVTGNTVTHFNTHHPDDIL